MNFLSENHLFISITLQVSIKICAQFFLCNRKKGLWCLFKVCAWSIMVRILFQVPKAKNIHTHNFCCSGWVHLRSVIHQISFHAMFEMQPWSLRKFFRFQFSISSIFHNHYKFFIIQSSLTCKIKYQYKEMWNSYSKAKIVLDIIF